MSNRFTERIRTLFARLTGTTSETMPQLLPASSPVAVVAEPVSPETIAFRKVVAEAERLEAAYYEAERRANTPDITYTEDGPEFALTWNDADRWGPTCDEGWSALKDFLLVHPELADIPKWEVWIEAFKEEIALANAGLDGDEHVDRQVTTTWSEPSAPERKSGPSLEL